MLSEATAILSHRLDVILAEVDRLETELRTEGATATARDLTCLALELRLARRTLSSIIQVIDPPPPVRALSLARGGGAPA